MRQMKNFEMKNTGTICLELNTVKKKWCILLHTDTDTKKNFNFS